jgi:molybdopterin converting factor small subunit
VPEDRLLTVRLGGSLVSRAGGRTEFQLEGRNIMEMLRHLGQICPELQPMIEKNVVSVAVDGQIYRDALLHPLDPGNEIILLPRMAGG